MKWYYAYTHWRRKARGGPGNTGKCSGVAGDCQVRWMHMMEDRWSSSCSVRECNESVILLSKASDELPPQWWERCGPGHDVTDRLNTALHMEKSWFMWQHRSPRRVTQCACLSRQWTGYKNAKFGIMLIFVDCCYSDTCLGKEDVRVCALDGLRPKPVRTTPSPIQGLILLHACQMRAAIFDST